MKFILGRKINMTQVFDPAGKVTPVTILTTGPVRVTQVKKRDAKDGYDAVQVGYGHRKNMNKPLTGHLKDLGSFSALREFKITGGAEILSDLVRGGEINLSQFSVGEYVDVQGRMKGRGFAGVVKRHNFRGAPASHGHDHPRAPGSIGSMFPQHVRKGKRMAGRMGGTNVTVKNLEIIDIDPEKHLMVVKGAVPGANGQLVKIIESKTKRKKNKEE